MKEIASSYDVVDGPNDEAVSGTDAVGLVDLEELRIQGSTRAKGVGFRDPKPSTLKFVCVVLRVPALALNPEPCILNPNIDPKPSTLHP